MLVLEGAGLGGVTPETVNTSVSYPALLFDWLITLTLTLTLTILENIILEKSAVSKSGVYIDICWLGLPQRI